MIVCKVPPLAPPASRYAPTGTSMTMQQAHIPYFASLLPLSAFTLSFKALSLSQLVYKSVRATFRRGKVNTVPFTVSLSVSC